MKRIALALVCAGMLLSAASVVAAPATAPATPAELARGKALVVFGTCNDCHTAGWRESDGKLPVARWMTGSSIGFRGWWGTSYPTNVRRDFQSRNESDWLFAVHTRAGHPPMIWEDLRGMPDADLRAIYRFIRSLGPAGTAVPAAVEPWREPSTKFVDMRAYPPPAPGSR